MKKRDDHFQICMGNDTMTRTESIDIILMSQMRPEVVGVFSVSKKVKKVFKAGGHKKCSIL